MADFYTWNEKNSMERRCIERFLLDAERRMDVAPSRMPFTVKEGKAVTGWLRALLDRKPSEMEA